MSHCNMVADNICSQAGVKNNTDFSKYLTVATDMFFTLSNDEDADIRLLAGKCWKITVICITTQRNIVLYDIQ